MKYYLDKNQIERLASNKAVYAKGYRLYSETKISPDFSYNDTGILVTAEVKEDGQTHIAGITFDGAGLLYRYACSCDSFGVWRGGCAHVVAALLWLFERNREAAKISRIARASKTLLDSFEKRAFEAADKELARDIRPASPIVLLPSFYVDYSGAPGVTITIGREGGSMYVVKDVNALVHAFENEEIVRYGKNLELAHSAGLLTETSKEFLSLLQAEYRKADKASARRFYDARSGSKVFMFSPAGLDRFFAIFAGSGGCSEIGCDAGISKCKTMSLNHGAPSCLGIADKDGGAVIALSESIKLFEGESFGYILKNGVLHRIGMEYLEVMKMLTAALNLTGTGEIVIGAKDMRRFSAFLFPQLERLGLVDDTNINKYQPDAFSVNIYLDASDGIVTCSYNFDYKKDEGAVNRDYIGEYTFLKTLEIMGFSKQGEEGLFSLSGDDAIYNFYYAESGLAKLRTLAQIFATDAFLNLSKKSVKPASFGLRINGGLLEVDISGDYSPKELLEALESYRLKKTYHKLTDGRYMSFEGDSSGAETDDAADTMERLDALFSGLDISAKDIKDGHISVPKYRSMYAAAQLDGVSEVSFDDGIRKLLADFKAKDNAQFDVPSSLADILRPYQKEGFKWLATLSRYGFGGILADDMGLGKTIQVLALFLYYHGNYGNHGNDGNRLPSIVVAPTSLIYNWEKEAARFTPSLKTMILSGAAAKRSEDFFAAEDIDVFITTYDMLKRDIDNYKDARFRFIVADEAQNIKNPGTQNARAIKRLNGEVRLALTGTPIENALSELWSIFDFAMPGYLFSAAKYTKIYETPILREDCKKSAANLRKQISPFILRRLKSQVLTELPEKVETTLYADMTAEQKKVYDAYLLKTKGELEEAISLGKQAERHIEILSMLTRLRQICCHPSTFIENYAGGSGKLDLTVETVNNSLAAGSRVLIFSQFTKMLSILMSQLDDSKVNYFYLDGATPSKERLEMTEAFNAGEREAFLISLKAGGAGLNLTGADVVVHYDPWWNPAVMNQAADRAHRFGQKRMVQVFNIVSKDSIEEKIIALQGMKKNIVDNVIEGTEAGFVNKLTPEEILELFGNH